MGLIKNDVSPRYVGGEEEDLREGVKRKKSNPWNCKRSEGGGEKFYPERVACPPLIKGNIPGIKL